MVDFGGGVFEEAAAGFLPAVEEEDGVATEQGGDVGSDDGFVVVGVGVYSWVVVFDVVILRLFHCLLLL